MTHLTSSQITLGKTASLLGIVQGLIWFVMSLLCIIEFSIGKAPASLDSEDSYMDKFNKRVYLFYLYKDVDLPPGFIVTPVVFVAFMAIYILLNTIWVVVSLFQLSVLNKNSVNIPVLYKDWAIITWIISLEDFILVVLLGSDYGEHCLDALGEEICINTTIPVLVIAARGFILWCVNVILAWMMLKSAKTLRKGGSYEGTFGGIIPLSRPAGQIPRANVNPNSSLYHQDRNINNDKTFWNVNLRTAMDNRTPPVSPRTPYEKNQQFFSRY